MNLRTMNFYSLFNVENLSGQTLNMTSPVPVYITSRLKINVVALALLLNLQRWKYVNNISRFSAF